MQPTIILIHGAFAESASWDGVIDPLHDAGHTVIAAANPLRGLSHDAEMVGDLVRSVEGPVLLVAHSYGGMVMSNVDPGAGDIVGLVYVGAFAPAAGEDAISLSEKFPGGTLGKALEANPRSDGTTDLTIARDRFHEQFCADLPTDVATRMASTQRPVTQEALSAASGEPLWKEQPSWFLFGEEDRNIPAELQRFMADRAGALRVVGIEGGSHAIGVSNPEMTAELVLEAAAAPVLG
ncbi:MAG TPA: alpha/beta hydrolase [Solirubrobacterales bacterium]|nr:alpha/beta hydrolase [Solirubrobacterales bacterium]